MVNNFTPSDLKNKKYIFFTITSKPQRNMKEFLFCTLQPVIPKLPFNRFI